MNTSHKILINSVVCLSFYFGFTSCYTKKDYSREINNCVSDLNKLLHTQEGWIKVHAAEYLLWMGHGGHIRSIYLEEERKYGDSIPYRIGIWRVLAQSADKQIEKKYWSDKIVHAFLDEAGGDRVHAIESLAKLRTSAYSYSKSVTDEVLTSQANDLYYYTKWSVSHTSSTYEKEIKEELLALLLQKNSYSISNKSIALLSFILKQMDGFSNQAAMAFIDLSLKELDTSSVRLDLLSAAYSLQSHHIDTAIAKELYARLIDQYEERDGRGRIQVILALARKNITSNKEILQEIYQLESNKASISYDPDVHATSAYACILANKN